ncbi:MAG: restriction endonuclease subunit S [Anaerolineales bacterium]|nr:restriction endonuclease subunit S [Anaerolineales bacterium]
MLYSEDNSFASIESLPDGWDLVNISDVAEVVYGKANPKTEGPYPLIGSGGIFGWVEEPLIDSSTIVIGRKGSAGSAYYIEDPCYPSDTTFFLEWKDKDRLEPIFLYYWLLLYPLSGQDAKTTLPSLRKPDLEEYSFPLPPLPEQRAIVQVLSTVRRAIEATDAVIAAARELKRSLLEYLFTYGPVPVDEAEKVHHQDLDEYVIPGHWRSEELGKIATAKGGTSFPNEYQGQQAGKYPFYKVSDMNLSGNEIFMTRANNWIDDETVDELNGRVFPAGTVIFPKVGGAVHTEKKRVLTRDSLVDNNVMAVTVQTDSLDPGYLFNWFRRIKIASFSNPGPLPSITQSAVETGKLPVPPSEEQKMIKSLITAVDRKIAAETSSRSSLGALYTTLLHELMTGRMRMLAIFDNCSGWPMQETNAK